MTKSHEAAFPVPALGQKGMTIRDVFAMLAPKPSESEMAHEFSIDKMRNPHGDSHKPPRRGALEIEWELRYRWADAGIAARGK